MASEFAAVFGKEVGHPSRRLVRVLFALLPQAAGTMQLAALTVRGGHSQVLGARVEIAEVLVGGFGGPDEDDSLPARHARPMALTRRAPLSRLSSD